LRTEGRWLQGISFGCSEGIARLDTECTLLKTGRGNAQNRPIAEKLQGGIGAAGTREAESRIAEGAPRAQGVQTQTVTERMCS